MPELSVGFGELTFKNPLILAPGPFSDDLRWISRFAEAGVGGVVLKSAVPESLAYMRRWVRPRYKLPFGPEGNFVLYSFEQAFRGSIDEYFKLIRGAKELGVPVIASFFALDLNEWLELCMGAQEAGADAVELDISCPHAGAASAYAEVTSFLAERLSIPVIPKLSPTINVASVAVQLERAGAGGVTACNRLTGVDVDLEGMRIAMHGSYAGFGGPWSKFLIFKNVMEIHRSTSLPISASGGVTSHEDLIKYILLGASTVQALSIFILRGVGVVPEMLEGLERFMEERGIGRLEEIRGLAARTFLPPDSVERDQRVRFEVDGGRCIGCMRCRDVCRYEAVGERGGGAWIDPELCDGCGLCAEVCPRGCIRMVKL